jgi:TRAP-type mannitol/chloroaromatic compound transport system permease large subunit
MQEMPQADKQIAAMLVKRDAFNLSETLVSLMGSTASKLIFGIGVLGMGLSTIIILMLISGFVICEIFGFPHGGKEHKWGCMLAAIGVLGPFVWRGDAKFWLAVPTSTFCMLLLPIAYFTFLIMMNSKKILGEDMLKGGTRTLVNVLMGIACTGALCAASWSIWNKPAGFKWIGIAVAAAIAVGALVTYLMKRAKQE